MTIPDRGTDLALRRLPAVGKQFLDALRWVRLDADQDVAEVLDRVVAVLVTGHDEGLQDREVVSGFLVSHEQRVDATEGNAAKRSLSLVVVGGNGREPQEAAKLLVVLEDVADGGSHLGARFVSARGNSSRMPSTAITSAVSEAGSGATSLSNRGSVARSLRICERYHLSVPSLT